MANYKLGDKILEGLNQMLWKYNLPKIDTLNFDPLIASELSVGYYDPSVEQSYPEELLRVMLDLIYTGHSTWADTLLQKAWPDSVANKRLFYEDVMQMVRSDPYWPELQQSNW